MAQTRTITRRKLRAIAALDLIGRPVARAADSVARRTGRTVSDGAPRILVVELWGLGDVVLTTPLLQAVREALPSAHLALLAKPWARTLLDGSGLVDEVIAFDFPWTAHADKYAIGRYQPRGMRELFRELRGRRFDVHAGRAAGHPQQRRDLSERRGTARRIRFRRRCLSAHGCRPERRSERAQGGRLAAARGAGTGLHTRAAASETVRQRGGTGSCAAVTLGRLGIDVARPLAGVHPGASHPVRRWDAARLE
jgi:hypothetical protein